jgi:hypothetical protein
MSHFEIGIHCRIARLVDDRKRIIDFAIPDANSPTAVSFEAAGGRPCSAGPIGHHSRNDPFRLNDDTRKLANDSSGCEVDKGASCTERSQICRGTND